MCLKASDDIVSAMNTPEPSLEVAPQRGGGDLQDTLYALHGKNIFVSGEEHFRHHRSDGIHGPEKCGTATIEDLRFEELLGKVDCELSPFPPADFLPRHQGPTLLTPNGKGEPELRHEKEADCEGPLSSWLGKHAT